MRKLGSRIIALLITLALLGCCAFAETGPRVTGTFLQPWAFTEYTADDWGRHMDLLLEAGIDTVILQWTADTPYGTVSEIFYPSDTECLAACEELLPRMLGAASERGMKVFVGLNMSDEWWQFACSDEEWNRTQAALGLSIAEEICGLYKAAYPDALYGWYIPWEMFNGMYGQEAMAASFLNLYLDGLNELSPDMPVMISPFLRSAGGTPDEAQAEWTKVFAAANFRPGDIFCVQDAVGAGHITIDELDAYYAAMKNAADTEEGLLFWANTECFRTVSENVLRAAPVDRFIRQMEIAEPYVSGYVTFAYSHYYAPDVAGTEAYHNTYLDYLNK